MKGFVLSKMTIRSFGYFQPSMFRQEDAWIAHSLCALVQFPFIPCQSLSPNHGGVTRFRYCALKPWSPSGHQCEIPWDPHDVIWRIRMASEVAWSSDIQLLYHTLQTLQTSDITNLLLIGVNTPCFWSEYSTQSPRQIASYTQRHFVII